MDGAGGEGGGLLRWLIHRMRGPGSQLSARQRRPGSEALWEEVRVVNGSEAASLCFPLIFISVSFVVGVLGFSGPSFFLHLAGTAVKYGPRLIFGDCRIMGRFDT